ILLGALRDPVADVRACAAESIERSFDDPDDVNEQGWIREHYRPFTYVVDTTNVEPLGASAAALATALKDPDDRVRVSMALTLYKLGRQASAARSALEAAASDRSAGVRFWAARALDKLDETPWRILRDLRAALGPMHGEPNASSRPSAQSLTAEIEAGADWSQRARVEWRWVLPSEPDARFESAARVVRTDLDAWMDRARSADPAVAQPAEALLRRAEAAVRDHIEIL